MLDRLPLWLWTPLMKLTAHRYAKKRTALNAWVWRNL